MLEPKEITVKDGNDIEREFIISKFPAIAGREIVAKYPLSGLPKLGDYSVNEETMLKLMKFVAVKTDAGELQLTTNALVDNHVPDWETLGRLEVAMMEYNCSFFRSGKISSFFDSIKATALQLTSKTLTDSLGQLLQTAKQASENSKKTTP
tara:strand:- start:2642 stop:3094 length:453 start_codon:yes stop_codon:yes gene_type:complete